MNLCQTPTPVVKICEWGPWASNTFFISVTSHAKTYTNGFPLNG